MRIRSLAVVVLCFGCAYSNYMRRSDESSYTATLSSPPPWEGSAVRVVVGPTVKYSRVVTWDDIGHSYALTSSVEESDGIPVEVVNQTDKDLQIDWERSSLVDLAGHSQRILHSGIDFADREKPQPPTVVSARSHLLDTVYPADGVLLKEGAWHHQIFLPTAASKGASPQLTLVLGIVMDGALVSVPQPITVDISGATATVKSGDKWPKAGALCNPLVGCATGFICANHSSDYRCMAWNK